MRALKRVSPQTVVKARVSARKRETRKSRACFSWNFENIVTTIAYELFYVIFNVTVMEVCPSLPKRFRIFQQILAHILAIYELSMGVNLTAAFNFKRYLR